MLHFNTFSWHESISYYFIRTRKGFGGRIFLCPLRSCYFNSEMVTAVTLPFCSIQLHFIWDARARFGITYSPQSSDIAKNSAGGISNFWISDQSLLKRNGRNSGTSYDIDMKLGSVTKLDKRNKTTWKNWRWRHVEKLRRHCHFSNLWPIWSNLEARYWMHNL